MVLERYFPKERVICSLTHMIYEFLESDPPQGGKSCILHIRMPHICNTLCPLCLDTSTIGIPSQRTCSYSIGVDKYTSMSFTLYFCWISNAIKGALFLSLTKVEYCSWLDSNWGSHTRGALDDASLVIVHYPVWKISSPFGTINNPINSPTDSCSIVFGLSFLFLVILHLLPHMVFSAPLSFGREMEIYVMTVEWSMLLIAPTLLSLAKPLRTPLFILCPTPQGYAYVW